MYIKPKYDSNDPFAGNRFDTTKTTMEVNGLKVTLNMPKAVKRKKDSAGNEITQSLPPYNPRPAFVVDEYPACPDNWMHGNSKSSSYFVPIMPEHGMWLDFQQNMNYQKVDPEDNELKGYNVAIAVSVQGINPLTGLKSDPIRLERYQEKCPTHEKEFGQNRFCEDCKYSWHPQNYLCSNNGSPFWIDGFRTEDGAIRQYYFTEEECKGIAAQVLGDDRVFAIGIAFYLSKKPKPKPTYPHLTYHYGPYGPYFWGSGCFGYGSTIYNAAMPYDGSAGSADAQIFCSTASWDSGLESTIANCSTGVPAPAKKLSGKKKGKQKTRRSRGVSGSSMRSAEVAPEQLEAFIGAAQSDVAATQKMLEIGAGAKISQQINPDPQDLDYWQEEPAGFIYINYCDVDTAQKILAVGKREEITEGFLAGLEIKD